MILQTAEYVADTNKMASWILGLCIVGVLGVLVQVVVGIVYTIRQESRFRTMLDIATEHGKTTDNQQQRTSRVGETIEQTGRRLTSASVQATRVATAAAAKAAAAVDAVQGVAGEVHELRQMVEVVVKKICPDQ